MLRSPSGLLGCPSSLDLPVNLWNFQTRKFDDASSVYKLQWKQSSDSQALRSIERIVVLFVLTLFLLHHAKLGAQIQKTGGAIAPPAPTCSIRKVVGPLQCHATVHSSTAAFINFIELRVQRIDTHPVEQNDVYCTYWWMVSAIEAGT